VAGKPADARRARSLLREPGTYVPPFEEALEDVVRNQDPKYLAEGQHLSLGFVGRRVHALGASAGARAAPTAALGCNGAWASLWRGGAAAA